MANATKRTKNVLTHVIPRKIAQSALSTSNIASKMSAPVQIVLNHVHLTRNVTLVAITTFAMTLDA